jgi:membrane fusion protein
MTQPLFRNEAIDHQRERLFGELILTQPVSYTLLTGLFVLITAAGLTFLFTNSYIKKETVAGFIVPDRGMVAVFAPQQGILLKINVVEGMHVNENDDLFNIIVDQRAMGGEYVGLKVIDELDTQEKYLNTKLTLERDRVSNEIASQEAKAKQLTEEIKKLKESIIIQNQRMEVETGACERAQRMFSKGLITSTDLETYKRNLLDQKQQSQTLAMKMDENVSSLEEISTNIISLNVNSRSELVTIESNISEIAKQKVQAEGQRQIVVKAPISGRITSVVSNVGQQLNPSISIFSIIPEGSQLEANLYLPTRAIGFLEIGQKVNIRYDAFSYQKFGTYPGTIKQIAKSVIMPGEMPSGLSYKEPVYKVVATLKSQDIKAYGKEIMLKPGMMLTADIILDERSLFEWLLEPLYSLRGRI